MPLGDAGKHAMLDGLAAVATRVSLHTGNPGTTGTSEVVGGSYARQLITWNPASGGELDDSNQPVFDVPAGTTVTHFGLWTTGGTYLGGDALSAPETFATAGTYTLTDADVTVA